MPILDAAVAFALTMLAIACLVTQVLRVIQHFTEKRGKELSSMLRQYFDQELETVVNRGLTRLGKSNSALSTHLSMVKSGWDKATEGSLFGKRGMQKKTCVHVSTEELAEWLKRSELGRELMDKLGAESQTVFDELARRYEIVGQRFTESFRKHSRRWSTAIAFVLALFVNIDAIAILKSFLRQPGASQAVIAQTAAIEAAAKKLGDLPAQGQIANGEIKDGLAKLQEAASNQAALLGNSGLPVGLDVFPHACLTSRTSMACTGATSGSLWLRSLKWIIGVVLTGLLAGLGSPFWYDVVASLTRVVKNAGTVRGARA